MYKVIMIGDVEVPMLAMASINIYYRQIFGADPLKTIMADDADGADLTNAYLQMGFVMAKFAELKNRKMMLQLNNNDYMDWLEQFDNGDLLSVLPEVRALYTGEKTTESTEKNELDG